MKKFTDSNNQTIKEIHNGLITKQFTAVELCGFFLRQIEEKDKNINAFLQASPQLALRQAKEIDKAIAGGKKLALLAGIPAAIKDAILVKDFNNTAASLILENFHSAQDATAVAKLREEGAVFLGRTNLDEFAMGSSTEHSAYKITRNPLDVERVPGGTSGGSAAAIAAGECVFALGSDTGGSIRQPAAFCGVVGLKPTYGRVSRYGLIAHASSLEQIGPMAKNVDDCEIVFDAIAGQDPKDSTSVDPEFPISNFQFPNIKIGIPKEYFGRGLDKDIKKAVLETAGKLEKQGVKIEEISLPNAEYALPCYYIIVPSEASANLARFDGIRYGKSEKAENLFGVYAKTRGRGLGEEVKRRIMLGTFALSSGYYDAYYLKAQKARTLIKRDFETAFEKVDFLLTPVSPFQPFKIGEKINDPLKMYLSDVYTISINLAGVPALSMPIPKAKVENMPVGLQIIGPHFSEKNIFHLAKAIEQL
ncbi:MAG: Asp-tRNA(Asn)/Glu-tRNA(Gln) amidotransferase subunit GatA [Patescibacteria group bacterium]|nr:Asp-tRNA(Asn)/Glu-tRNA(Gln) amidotransferase subunit GatA [Patescibacteria group bacterium]